MATNGGRWQAGVEVVARFLEEPIDHESRALDCGERGHSSEIARLVNTPAESATSEILRSQVRICVCLGEPNFVSWLAARAVQPGFADGEQR